MISNCLKILCTIIYGIRGCSVSNAAEPSVNVYYVEVYSNASYLLVLCHFSNIIVGRDMSNPFRFDVTNGYSC